MRVTSAALSSSPKSKMVEFAEFPPFTEGAACDFPGISSAKEYVPC